MHSFHQKTVYCFGQRACGKCFQHMCTMMSQLYLLVLALLCGSNPAYAVADAPFRLPGSPYPAPSQGPNCSVSLLAYSSSLQPSQLLLMSSLQGVAARTCPRLLRVGDGSPSDMQSAFASDLPSFGAHVNTSIVNDFPSLVAACYSFGIASGYVLCDMRVGESCAAATSFCAASDAGVVAVDVRDEAQVQKLLQIPRVYDARNSTVSDVVLIFPFVSGASWSARVAVLQDPAKLPFLCDFAVFARAVMRCNACAWFVMPHVGCR